MADYDESVAHVQEIVAAFRAKLRAEVEGLSLVAQESALDTSSGSESVSIESERSRKVELDKTEVLLQEALRRVHELECQLRTVSHSLELEKKQRRALADELILIKGNIRVFARIRPTADASGSCIEQLDERSFVTTAQRKQFEMDACLREHVSNTQVYQMHVAPLVNQVLEGRNCALLAYGQTGSGKTHTMLGTSRDPGLLHRALAHCLEQPAKNKSSVRLSAVQVYNDQVMDLLQNSQNRNVLDIRLDAENGEYSARGLMKTDVSSLVEAEALVNEAVARRAVGAHALNERSSRSHLVFFLETAGGGTLALVDLAGSERLSRTEATGERLKESQHINKSLAALGDVLNALASKDPRRHVPFRNSKLTFLLQSYLQGRSVVAFIACINPDSDSTNETFCTAVFAERIRRVELLGSSTSPTTSAKTPSTTPNPIRSRLLVQAQINT